MFIKYLTAIILVTCIISCSKNDRQPVTKKIDTVANTVRKEVDTLVKSIAPGDSLFDKVTVVTVDTSKLPSKNIREIYNDIFSSYEKIKDELANNDSTDSKKYAKEMLTDILEANEEITKEEGQKIKINPDKFQKLTSQIESANTLKDQRVLFDKLSDTMIEFLKQYGLNDKTVYVLSCKRDNNEWTWLSDSKETDNPYLTNDDSEKCIEVKQALKFN